VATKSRQLLESVGPKGKAGQNQKHNGHESIGSFAAALKEKDVWVMNVVPHDGPSTLKIIYDRGLIGSNHDWYVSTLSTHIKSSHFINFRFS
jgi:hypothetical protein